MKVQTPDVWNRTAAIILFELVVGIMNTSQNTPSLQNILNWEDPQAL